MGRYMVRDLPPRSPRVCVTMVPDRRGKHGLDIGKETGKGCGGAYKPRISYQIEGADRGDRVGAGRGAWGGRWWRAMGNGGVAGRGDIEGQRAWPLQEGVGWRSGAGNVAEEARA